VESEAYPYLAELGNGYFWLKLKSMMLLSSKHAQRWYELFSEKKDFGEWKSVELDYIRKVMMVDEFEYKRNEAFLRRVIYEPIKEVNEKTELFIQYEPMFKQKRPIIGFDFSIRGQKAKGEAEMYERIESHFVEFKALGGKEKADRIAELQRIYGFSPKAFNEMLENHSILNAVLDAHEKVEAGKIQIMTTKEQYMGGVIRKAKEKLV
jgi:plasmid replication initiation protein